MLKVGDKALDFRLLNQDGKAVSLADFKGKWVVLYFYPKDNTSGCTIEAVDFTSNKKDFDELGAVILGVSPDSMKSHCKFAERQNLTITLLSDIEKKVLNEYGAWGTKSMYGKGYEGVIRSTFLINPEGKLSYIWPKVQAKGHVDEVKKKLEELI